MIYRLIILAVLIANQAVAAATSRIIKPDQCEISLANMEFIGPRGEPVLPNLKDFRLADMYLSSSKILLNEKLDAAGLERFPYSQRPLAVVGKKKLSRAALSALNEAFDECWSDPFIMGTYGPKTDGVPTEPAYAGNGMTGHRIYRDFKVRLGPNASLDKIEIQWPHNSPLRAHTWHIFQNFAKGKAREAMEELIRVAVYNEVKMAPEHFAELYANDRPWIDILVIGIEYWGDLDLLKKLSPASYKQAMQEAKENGYKILNDPDIKYSAGGVHDDGTSPYPGVQNFFVIGKHKDFEGGDTIFYSWDGKKLGPVVGHVNLDPGEQALWGVPDRDKRGPMTVHLAGPFRGGYRRFMGLLFNTSGKGTPDEGSYGFEKRRFFPEN